MDEYLVVVREKSQREEQKSQEEIHRKIGKAIWTYISSNLYIYTLTYIYILFTLYIYIYIYMFPSYTHILYMHKAYHTKISTGFKLDSNNPTIFSKHFVLQAEKEPEVDPDAFSKLELLDARRQAEKASGSALGGASGAQEQEAGRYVSYPEEFELPCIYIYSKVYMHVYSLSLSLFVDEIYIYIVMFFQASMIQSLMVATARPLRSWSDS